MMPKQRTTMADVAREAGVSLMTVSRAINGQDGISETTGSGSSKSLTGGYRPSDIARSLVTDRTGTVGLVVIDNSNPFFSEIARGVEQQASLTAITSSYATLKKTRNVSGPCCARWRKKRVDGRDRVQLTSGRRPACATRLSRTRQSC